MINALLYKLSGRLRCRLIKQGGNPYLERYYVGELFGVTFYLHRFLDADGDREMHNHPYDAKSIVLCGGYHEDTAVDLCGYLPEGVTVRSRLVQFYNSVPGNKFHRITSVYPGTWTLFIRGRRQTVTTFSGIVRDKGWGFLQRTSLGRVTFEPVMVASGVADAWHKTGQRGATIGREAL